MKTDWDNLFKVRIASAARNNPKAMAKHEAIKVLLVLRLFQKYRKFRNMIRIYTEYELDNGCIVDVYFENIKTKDAIAFEIQKEYTEFWLNKKTNKFKDYTIPFFKTFDWIPIDLNDIPDSFLEAYEDLGKYV